MTYTPTSISTRDFETDEKVLRPKLVKANLDLIAQETKILAGGINDTKDDISSINEKRNTKLTPLVASLLFG